MLYIKEYFRVYDSSKLPPCLPMPKLGQTPTHFLVTFLLHQPPKTKQLENAFNPIPFFSILTRTTLYCTIKKINDKKESVKTHFSKKPKRKKIKLTN